MQKGKQSNTHCCFFCWLTLRLKFAKKATSEAQNSAPETNKQFSDSNWATWDS